MMDSERGKGTSQVVLSKPAVKQGSGCDMVANKTCSQSKTSKHAVMLERVSDAMISDRAYAIWEREGYPEGRAVEHWMAARKQLLGM